MTAFVLKIIASISMLLDHSYVVFPFSLPFIFFRYIGRIAFPVYAYMIAQGCKHSGDIRKYLLRLGIFAIISEVPFDLAFRNEISFISDTNIFYTLFLGTACIAVYQKITGRPSALTPNTEPENEQENKQEPGQKTFLKGKLPRLALSIILMVPIALLGNLLGTDYGTVGVIFILVFYFTKPEKRLTRTIAATCLVFYLYGYPYVLTSVLSAIRGAGTEGFLNDIIMSVPKIILNYFLFALFSVLLIFLYNGKPGPRYKWAFYVFYPAHLVVLVMIKYISGQA